MIRRLLLASALSLASFLAVPAVAAPPGFAFLEVPVGARASAMGGAYAAVAKGAEAAFWNPAGLLGTERTEISGTHYEWIESLRQDQFVLAGQLFGGGVAASLRSLYSEPIEQRDELGNLIGTFGSHDLQFGLGYGFDLGGGLSGGVSGQFVRERLAELSADTWGVDMGAAFAPESWGGVRAALAIQNLGPAAQYTLDGVPGRDVGLPLALHGGVSASRGLGTLTLLGALDSRLTVGRPGVVALGAELASPIGASLRAGLRMNDDLATASFGVGYAARAYAVDYAFVPSKLDLADTHRFSFSARF